MGQVEPRLALGATAVVNPLHFPVEPMAHLLKHDVRISVFARMLPVGYNAPEDLIHVSQVEVSTQGQVLGSPVVAA